MAHIKGQNVNLLIDGSVVAASTTCDFSVTANTADAAAKDDANPLWDNPAFTYYDWSASNESFVVDVASLKTLLTKVITGDCTVQVQFQVGTSSTDKLICKKGTAIITSLDVDAPSDDYAKVTISLEGAAALAEGTWTEITPVTTVRNKIRGKALMIAVQSGSGESISYNTVCAATSHKLSLSVQTADTKTKDDNDKAISKDVTGKSLTLSTENLVDIHDDDSDCHNAATILTEAMNGTSLTIQFGYYPNSIGAAVTDDSARKYSWGAPTTLLISGSFLCSSFSVSGANKDNATMSAEFTCQGVPTVAA